MDHRNLRGWHIFDVLKDDELERVKIFYVFGEGSRQSALFITRADVVYGIGYNGDWNLLGFTEESMVKAPEAALPTEVTSLSTKGISSICVGSSVGAAITQSKRLYFWGRSYKRGNDIEFPHQLLVRDYCFVQVACGEQFVAAMSSTNCVYLWGLLYPSAGHCSPFRVSRDLKVTSISCGLHHIAMLASNGKVYTCGFGFNGQLGRDFDYCANVEARAVTLNDICVQVACGTRSTIFLTKSGSVFACGINLEAGFLGVRTKGIIEVPQRVTLNPRVDEISANFSSKRPVRFAAITTSTKKVFHWGEQLFPTEEKSATVLIEAYKDIPMPFSCSIAPQLVRRESSQGNSPPERRDSPVDNSPEWLTTRPQSPVFLPRSSTSDPPNTLASLVSDIVDLRDEVMKLYHTFTPLLDPTPATFTSTDLENSSTSAPQAVERNEARRAQTYYKTNIPEPSTRNQVPWQNVSATARTLQCFGTPQSSLCFYDSDEDD